MVLERQRLISMKVDEKKRSRVWLAIMLISTAALILVAAYFMGRMMFANPLSGTWEGEDLPLTLSIGHKDAFTLRYTDEEGKEHVADGSLLLDRSNKEVTLHFSPAQYEKAGVEPDTQWESYVQLMDQSYNYSVERGQLFLTDREYGENYVFSGK